MNGRWFQTVTKLTAKEYQRGYFQRRKAEDPKWYSERKAYMATNYKRWEKRDWTREYKRRRRLQVIEHYGGKCNCCGESQPEFLAIDHINNDGAEHRRQLTITIVDWLIQNNYPEGFQVLCHNCNSAKYYYGECPHSAILVKR